MSIDPLLFQCFALFLRTGAVAATMPVIGEQILPQRFRLFLALALAFLLLPSVENAPISPAILLTEPLAGLALGLSIRSLFFALNIAGSIIGQSMSLSQFLGNPIAESSTVISELLMFSALALLATLQFPVLIFELLLRSYEVFPIGATISPGALAQWFTQRIDLIFALSFSLAAPFVIVSLLYNLGLGFMNRAMPQLMVMLIGAPLVIAAALGLLVILSGAMLARWLGVLEVVVGAPFGVL